MTRRDFLTEKETSEYLSERGWPQAVSTLQNKRVVGGGIPFVKRGNMIRYRLIDVDAWLGDLQTIKSTSELGR